jgi:hypothetical protein
MAEVIGESVRQTNLQAEFAEYEGYGIRTGNLRR